MKATLEKLLAGTDLDEQESAELLIGLCDEAAPPAIAGAVLAALRVKGETAVELRGFVRAMRALAKRPDLGNVSRAVDVVGTGGDGASSVNLSTGTALLVAACGQPVVKHGNRAVSSRCGSADVLEALGLPVPLDEQAAGRALRRIGFTFLFAPHYHPALSALAGVRRTLGVRTIFNVLGPLTNPAEPPFGLLGAFSEHAAAKMAESLAGLPIARVFVVHGAGGWDEPTPVGPFVVFDVRPGSVARVVRDPASLGIARCAPSDLAAGQDPADNAARLSLALRGGRGAVRDALVLGAALALEVTGAVASARDGIAAATAVINDGGAARLLDALPGAGFPAGAQRQARP